MSSYSKRTAKNLRKKKFSMRVLFDIVHPADVLFFYNTIKTLEAQGDDYIIVSRHKDVTCELLDKFDLKHRPITKAGSGIIQLGGELIKRNLVILKIAKQFKPNVMIGFGGVAISHVGKLLRIPAISYYDTDTAKLQNAISFPFISHLYVPDVYAGKTPKGRTSRFKGLKELSYFHPDAFKVDEEKALKNGWSKSEDNFFIRAVMWRASHDAGKSGWSDATFMALIDKLSKLGKVHISSERPLPASLEGLRYRGEKTEVHHLMAKCKLYVGESLTMAQEAAFLGTQAIYGGHDVPGTTQSVIEAGLVSMPQNKSDEALFDLVENILQNDKGQFNENYSVYMSKHPPLTQHIIAALGQHSKLI